MLKKEEKIFVGIDESNHGRFPEIFVAVYSKKPQHSFYLQHIIKKDRQHYYLKEKLKNILDYNFLILEKDDLKNIKREKISIKSIIIASLIKGISSYNKKISLEILVDGCLTNTERELAKNLIYEVEKIPLEYLSIRAGNKFDEHVLVVNYADEIAHYLFRKKTLEELNSEEYLNRKKYLILDYYLK